jgi:hypothetical protein
MPCWAKQNGSALRPRCAGVLGSRCLNLLLMETCTFCGRNSVGRCIHCRRYVCANDSNYHNNGALLSCDACRADAEWRRKEAREKLEQIPEFPDVLERYAWVWERLPGRGPKFDLDRQAVLAHRVIQDGGGIVVFTALVADALRQKFPARTFKQKGLFAKSITLPAASMGVHQSEIPHGAWFETRQYVLFLGVDSDGLWWSISGDISELGPWRWTPYDWGGQSTMQYEYLHRIVDGLRERAECQNLGVPSNSRSSARGDTRDRPR